jgi:hypothetical protein
MRVEKHAQAQCLPRCIGAWATEGRFEQNLPKTLFLATEACVPHASVQEHFENIIFCKTAVLTDFCLKR